MNREQAMRIEQFMRQSAPRRRVKNLFASAVLGFSAFLVIIPLVSILAYVVIKGLPGLRLSFFLDNPKPVGEAGGGMKGALAGSGMLIRLASLIGIPWGLCIGIFLSEYGDSKLAGPVRLASDLLAGIPSIIIGLFVYFVVVAPMKGFSALAGAIALAIILIPIIARTSEEILKMVPLAIREGGLALGIPRWTVILRVVVHGSMRSIATGIMLALARGAGETAPLLFTAFNNRFFSMSLTDPISSLPVQLYTYAISPFDEWHEMAWTGALVLVSVALLANLATKILLRPPAARGAPFHLFRRRR